MLDEYRVGETAGPEKRISALQAFLQNAVGQLEHGLPEFTAAFPGAASSNGFYSPTPNNDWTNGFITGEYWLAWQLSGEACFKAAALTQVDSFMQRIKSRVVVDHHDMGFLYQPSCVQAYQLTGSETGRKAALMAADNLLGRFQEKGQFFQAWGRLGDPAEYRMIIDCLLNLPLLFWASETTGNPVYRQKATAHIQTAASCLLRADGSTCHTFYFDTQTGKPLYGATAQGYKADSAWARGQAWGIYGFALAYRYTGEEACRVAFQRVTEYYLHHLPKDFVPFWDLCFSEQSGEPRDSSAAAIAACGLLEMLPCLDEGTAAQYRDIVLCTATELAANYAVTGSDVSNGLLLHGVYAKSSPYNTVKNSGVDECTAWGDYFYLELLARLCSGIQSPW